MNAPLTAKDFETAQEVRWRPCARGESGGVKSLMRNAGAEFRTVPPPPCGEAENPPSDFRVGVKIAAIRRSPQFGNEPLLHPKFLRNFDLPARGRLRFVLHLIRNRMNTSSIGFADCSPANGGAATLPQHISSPDCGGGSAKRRWGIFCAVCFFFEMGISTAPGYASVPSHRPLCFDAPYSDDAVAVITDSEGPKAQFMDDSSGLTGVRSAEYVLSFLRSMSGDWKTPLIVWSNSAFRVTIREDGVESCQILVDDDLLYAMVDEKSGFLSYEMSPREKLDLKRILERKRITYP